MSTRSVRIAKRSLDVVAASVGLLLTAPLYPAIALAIRLDSRGPTLFRQRRVAGLRAEPHAPDGPYRCFTLFKFRTMCDDAERTTGAVLSSRDDPRITRVGRFLRRSRLDELPQLWNVLRGDMSLVGPRPERPELTADLASIVPYFEERLRAKPGLTGLAQVHLGYTGAIPEWSALWGLGATLQNPYELDDAEGALADDMRAKLLYDLAYVASLEDFRRWLATELSVLCATPMVMIRKLGE
jgi:lipopolysaccharide/colanic/teichoic acid biosynthesis glycosyltransferase